MQSKEEETRKQDITVKDYKNVFPEKCNKVHKQGCHSFSELKIEENGRDLRRKFQVF